MDRAEIEQILSEEDDVERARAKIEALLEAERLQLERDRSDRDDERLDREKRRWYANPLFVAVSVGALTLFSDFIVSSLQGRQDLLIQRERAASDLIRSAFVDEPEQTIRNLEFMIAAQLIEDPDKAIINAAEEFGPRETVTPVQSAPAVQVGVFDPPIFTTGTVERIVDGDSLTVRLDFEFVSGGPVPRVSSDGVLSASLAGVDAAELSVPGCDSGPESEARVWGEKARALAIEAMQPGQNRRVRFVLTEVDRFGRLHLIVAPTTRVPDDPRRIFDQSLNATLLKSGLGIPAIDDELPETLWTVVRGLSRDSEASGEGMFAEVSRRIDLDDVDLSRVPPWLARRVCFLMRRGTAPETYFENYFNANGAVFLDAETNRRLSGADIVRVDGSVVEQLRPLHSLKRRFVDP
ncbi:MAG: hypothetical protein AAFY31_03650 [Pseudomonadota bacterium]